MIPYAIMDETGVVIGRGECVNLDDLVASSMPGGSATGIGDGENPRPMQHYLGADNEFHPLPAKPGPWARWNGTAWTDPRSAAQRAADAAKVTAGQWAALRAERDRLLALCDWTQFPDAPVSVTGKLAWQSYRRALRDLPEKTADPARPVWPTPPKR